MRLRCPSCGRSPLFVPLVQVRSLRDWFTPLDGCPRCGYPYEREMGYYLMAVWAVNYGAGALLGLGLYAVLELAADLSLGTLLCAVLTPAALFNIVFARHAKALFLAVDLFFDPHEREGDGGIGCTPCPSTPPASGPSAPEPCPREPALR